MANPQLAWSAISRQRANDAAAPGRTTRRAREAAPARVGREARAGARDEWLTVDEVCDELNIGRRTFERWRTLGIAPRATRPTRNGPLRIKRSWLEEWAEDGAT